VLDQEWLAVADAACAAAVGALSWNDALAALATATGSRSGQLIGVDAANSVPFHYTTDLGPNYMEEFAAIGGGDPRVNPVVRAGAQQPALKTLSTAEFITPKERRRSEFLLEHARRYDISYACLTTLIKEPGMLIGLAVLRSVRQGEISHAQRRVFTSLAPHLRMAVRMQTALEHQGAQILAGGMEALSLAVFVCDRQGAVRAMTLGAERLVSRAGPLQLKQGRLRTGRACDTRALTDAVARAAGGLQRPGPSLATTVVVQDASSKPVVIDVLPLPQSHHSLGFAPRALVVVRREAQSHERAQHLLQAAYHLTAAETDVALRLSEGVAPEAIAAARGVSVATVRVQMRAIFSKLDVHRQSELAARLAFLRQ
jgi:DNA-binding CsgD family transcriptional regulator